MAQSFTIRRLALTSDAWTPVVVPIHSSSFTIENCSVVGILIRSDEDLSHYKRLSAGAQYTIASVVATFDPDTIVCWIQTTGGPGMVAVTFVR